MAGARLRTLVSAYDPNAPLDGARTIPSQWYTDADLCNLECDAVFATSWQVVGRTDQVQEPGNFITCDIAGEPVIVMRGMDNYLRAFYNVCRHHAAIIESDAAGSRKALRCPYHGWTYDTTGALKSTPEFEGVCDFDKSQNGLVPVAVETWEQFVLVRLSPVGFELSKSLVAVAQLISRLSLDELHFFDRREYMLDCNWKVFVDNYLDGGYHVPYAHKSLNTVIKFADYTIENVEYACIQSTPMKSSGADEATASVRSGDRAYYVWLYPNFMLNWYDGYMDTNLVLPLGVNRCKVVFEFYFADVGAAAADHNRQSVEVADRVQDEDIELCALVQRGLRSRSYDAGRLSVRREAGEHLFHRLLHRDLGAELDRIEKGV